MTDRLAVSAVALGGGHGLAASLSALRRVTSRLTAVVTVADDGGSSGRLRRELGVLPPGDLRMALAALCSDDEWGQTWSRVAQHRFRSEGALHDHALGNLLIVALWELLGDSVEGLDWVARLLAAEGRVLPMSVVPLDIEATVRDASPPEAVAYRKVCGQQAVAKAHGVEQIELLPSEPPACPEAVSAVLDAEWVVLGPGSWFTSVIPHLLVPELAAALGATSGRRLVALNLAPQQGETEGLSPQAHLDVLAQHAPTFAIDVVLADEMSVPDVPALERAAARVGAELMLAPVRRDDGTPRHDPELLASAYRTVFSTPRHARERLP